jgi:two-component system response regulator PilR (NtrC family)
MNKIGVKMPATYLALIVDDEPDIRELLDLTLTRMNVKTRMAESLAEAYEFLKHETFHVCLTDMNLLDGNGISLVQHIQRNYPKLPVAVITAYGNAEAAVLALKAGAFDFVSKPVELSRLRELVNVTLKLTTPESEQQGLEFQRLLGSSEHIKHLRESVHKLARSQAPVYISGESGTGKEVVARLIHDLGPRADNAFVPVNCGAIPSELMESEFFGHKKGSFTGATEDKKGLFQAADQGTLFLDEVADLPLTMQVKLLRAIQEKSIRPVGSVKEIPINVRILSATHKDLQGEMNAGRFRQDLFYRINVIQLKLLPLRERANDMIVLAQYFLQKISDDWGVEPFTLSDDAIIGLKNYSFPGNVRELQNVLERAMTLCDSKLILPEHLQLSEHLADEQLSLAALEPTSVKTEPFMTSIAGLTSSQLPIDSLENYLFQIEKETILKALEETRWNRTAAAKKLGMTFRSLRYRLKKMGLDTDEEDV